MANDFSDSRIVEYWLFDNNLNASKNGNDLTASAGGVGYESGSPLKGTHSLKLARVSNQWALRTDANLSAGFPLKNGDAVKTGTFVFWCKPTIEFGFGNYLISKAGSGTGISAYFYNVGTYSFYITWGYGAGTESWNVFTPTSGTTYHIGIAFDGITKSCLVRIWDGATATTYNHTFSNTLSVGAGDFIVGVRHDKNVNQDYTGLVDELVVANTSLADWEIDLIRQDSFGILLPTLTTLDVTDIKSDSAVGNGTVLTGAGITQRGFCWSTLSNPTTSDNKVIVAGTTGSYSGNITGLDSTTTYYVKAYAINPVGTGYGNQVDFTTLFPEEDETFSEPKPGIIMGEYEVPDNDIIEIGEIRTTRAQDLSITSSGVTIVLDNNTGKYSPGKNNFIWAGSTWYLKEVEMNLTYQDAGESFIVFKGVITNWKVNEIKDAAYDATPEAKTVEITVDDHCSLLENRMIGKPNDDGSPNPYVHGRIFRQAETINDLTFWEPTDDIDYETGDLSQIDSTVIDGTGAMAASTTDPYEGSYCAVHSTSGAGNAYGKQDILGASGSTDIMITAMIKFTSIPPDPVLNNLHIFEIQDTAGSTKMSVCSTWSGDDRDLFALDIPLVGTYASNVHITDYLDRWFRLSLLAVNDNTDRLKCLIKVFLDGEEIISKPIGSLTPNFRYVTWGIKQGGIETWGLSTDNVQCFNVAYPNGYYLSGGAYQEINAVYVDGGFWPRRNIKRWRAYPVESGWVWWLGYVGRTSLPENYRVDLNYCLIDFLDLENPVSGSVLIDALKDFTTHPVDIIEDILTEVELDTWIDDNSFAAAATATPDDIIGIYIDNQSSSDVITDICQKMLLSFYEYGGKMKLIPYTGNALTSSILTLNQNNCHSMEQNIDMVNLRNEVQVKWGWFDRNKRLFYRTQNTEFIALVGTQTYDFDLSYGQDISVSDKIIAQAKADLLLRRIGGPLDEYIIGGNLILARLTLGDGVLLQSSFSDTDAIYEVMEKTVNLMEKTVEVVACRYMGES